MGTQQILMIIISVIIIGASVVIGIYMFDLSGVNSQRQMMISDLHIYSDHVFAYMKTTSSMGGGAGKAPDINNLAEYLGFKDADLSITTHNGKYTLKSFTAGADPKVEILAENTQIKISLTATIKYTLPSQQALSIETN
jgi:hypothetical protein